MLLRIARLTDDADYYAGETSGNVPRPRSYSGNYDAYNRLRTSLNLVVMMITCSYDVRHMTDESLTLFHQNRRILPRKQRHHEYSSKANRQLIKRNPPLSSGGIDLRISSPDTLTRSGNPGLVLAHQPTPYLDPVHVILLIERLARVLVLDLILFPLYPELDHLSALPLQGPVHLVPFRLSHFVIGTANCNPFMLHIQAAVHLELGSHLPALTRLVTGVGGERHHTIPLTTTSRHPVEVKMIGTLFHAEAFPEAWLIRYVV
ncbi:unnamed protein product [Protopolystoma xenopodis]|uniref:Uncharacterized protein n=1 Tax=Protopolystoma xenopodis TaxID=117903 RepID=A0A3S5FGX8_9PLAT|nr:unnamed protein product [Protopolystoma xenopodis]